MAAAENAAAMTAIGYEEQSRGIARCVSCRTDSLSVSSEMSPWVLCMPPNSHPPMAIPLCSFPAEHPYVGSCQPVCILDCSVELVKSVSCVSSGPTRFDVRQPQQELDLELWKLRRGGLYAEARFTP